MERANKRRREFESKMERDRKGDIMRKRERGA
jgi:hypothetical protein